MDEWCLTWSWCALKMLAEWNKKIKVSLIVKGIKPQAVSKRSGADGRRRVCQRWETTLKSDSPAVWQACCLELFKHPENAARIETISVLRTFYLRLLLPLLSLPLRYPFHPLSSSIVMFFISHFQPLKLGTFLGQSYILVSDLCWGLFDLCI